MKRTVLLTSILSAILIVFAGCAQSERSDSQTADNPSASASQQHGQKGESGRGGKTGFGDEGKSEDEDLQAMIAEVAPSFTQESYDDPETGLTVPYELYLPQDYSEGNVLNFITWETGTVLGAGAQSSVGVGEHMASFDYGYKLSSVRDWIFEQHK